jgi:hypothetical protein
MHVEILKLVAAILAPIPPVLAIPHLRIGPIKEMSRTDQKGQLAQLLFVEDPDDEDRGPSEVFYGEAGGHNDDAKTTQHKKVRLVQAMNALRLSIMLKEAGCVSLSLSELCKRRLQVIKGGAASALRAANLALDIAGDGSWDPDLVALEANDGANVVEGEGVDLDGADLSGGKVPNPSTHGLSNPALCGKFVNARVGLLCKRSGLLQKGNALQALKKFGEAREAYEQTMDLLKDEVRVARVDWERHSILLNIGNTYLAEGDFETACSYYSKASDLGTEHVENELGSTKDGKNMVCGSRKALARAHKVNGNIEEAKKILGEIVAERRIAMEEEALEAEKEEELATSPKQVAAN